LRTSANYAFHFVDGVLTITRATLQVTANDANREYGAANPTFDATISGFANTQTLATSGVTGAPSCASTATGTSPVGTPVAITCTAGTGTGALASANYAFHFVDGVLTITRATLQVTATSSPASQQYSDLITLSATVSPTSLAGSTLTGTITFKIDGAATGAALPIVNGTATQQLAVTQPSGSHTVTALFTPSQALASNFASETGTTPLTVTKENAYIEYTGDSFKNTASPSINTATVNLSAVVREAGAVGAPASSDTTIGDKLSTTSLTFTVTPYTGSAPPPCTVQVTPTGTGTGSAACQVTLAAGDPYTVTIALAANGYYVADSEEAAVTVALPGTGFTTGGGWINEPNLGTKSNFGFNAKRLKNGSIQGNSLYIYRTRVTAGTVGTATPGVFLPAGDYNFQMKSNSWQGGGLSLSTSCNTTTSPFSGCTATFSGKANLTAIDRLSGVAYSLGGGYSYRVDVTDFGEPGSKASPTPDTYGLKVWNSSGTYYQLYSGPPPNASTFPQLALNGGNIQVRP
jgi:hypothetical protein